MNGDEDRSMPNAMEQPQYLRIADHIEQRLRAGTLARDGRLPAERLLGEEYATSRVTLREALLQLEMRGLLYRQDRRGWFVTPPRLRLNPTEPTNFHEIVRRQGGQPETRLIEQLCINVPAALARQLEVGPLAQVYLLKRLRHANGRALCYCENYCLPERVPGLLEQDLNGSLTELYARVYQLHYHHMRLLFQPTALSEPVARHLGATPGLPALRLERLNLDRDGRPIDIDIEIWRHDSLEIEVFTRDVG
jgi:phosphonate utilization transcriptional regulator PhnR